MKCTNVLCIRNKNQECLTFLNKPCKLQEFYNDIDTLMELNTLKSVPHALHAIWQLTKDPAMKDLAIDPDSPEQLSLNL